jgi:hypothetical protein
MLHLSYFEKLNDIDAAKLFDDEEFSSKQPHSEIVVQEEERRGWLKCVECCR